MRSDPFAPFLEGDSALRLRRYLAFWKFEQLVSSGTMYFAPASEMKDSHEGAYTEADDKHWESQLIRWRFEDRGLRMAREAKTGVHQHNQIVTLLVCWTATPTEQPRMWKEYTGDDPEAVALETTVGALRNDLGVLFPIIRIRYIDETMEVIPKEHSVFPYCYKRRSYEWENEVRVIGDMELGKRIGTPRLVKIAVGDVLARIILSPLASPAFATKVPELLNRHGLSVPVGPSSIAA